MQSYYSLKIIDSSKLTQEQRHTLGEALLYDRDSVVYVVRNGEVFSIDNHYEETIKAKLSMIGSEGWSDEIEDYYSWLDEELCCDDDGFTAEAQILEGWGIEYSHIDPEEVEEEEE